MEVVEFENESLNDVGNEKAEKEKMYMRREERRGVNKIIH